VADPVTKPIPDYLRLYTERSWGFPKDTAPSVAENLCQAFERATGWSLAVPRADTLYQSPELPWSAPVNPGVGATPGQVGLGLIGRELAATSVCEESSASALAGAIGSLVDEVARLRRTVWEREAELAAGVPLIPHRDEREHLAARLEGVLKSGAEAVGGQAAGLYLLDAATTHLKLRASWGLPGERLLDQPRPLGKSPADVEALAGHAVTISNAAQHSLLIPPEPFPAALCLPVSSPTIPLGTFWLFSDQERTFSDHEVQLVEVVTGRLAAELERSMLLAEGIDGARMRRGIASAQRWQNNQQPRVAPLVDQWDLAGWTDPRQIVAGLHDWFTRDDDVITFAVAGNARDGLEGALAASMLRAGLRAHGEYTHDPGRLLDRLHRTLWTASAGDQAATLFCGQVAPYDGSVQFAWAGHPAAWRLTAADVEPLTDSRSLLGSDASQTFAVDEVHLEPGELLVVMMPGGDHKLRDRPEVLAALAELPTLRRKSARFLLEVVRERLETSVPEILTGASVVVVQHRR